MKTALQLVEEINVSSICSPQWLEDEIDLCGAKEITIVNRDEHRWYWVGTMVFKIGEEFFGVRGPTSLKSESMGFDDTGIKCEAFLMEEFQTVTYKRKSK